VRCGTDLVDANEDCDDESDHDAADEALLLSGDAFFDVSCLPLALPLKEPAPGREVPSKLTLANLTKRS